MRTPRVAVIGAGAGGSGRHHRSRARGAEVTLLDSAPQPGRQTPPGASRSAGAPRSMPARRSSPCAGFSTNCSRRREPCSTAMSRLRPLELLARHAWSERRAAGFVRRHRPLGRCDRRFAGAGRGRRLPRLLRPGRANLPLAGGAVHPRATPHRAVVGDLLRPARPGDLLGLVPFSTLWRALGDHFRDPRLRQLFGRYATYSGSSPFQTPATLMLIAHVEQQGVWTIDGGMARLAGAMAGVATKLGAAIRHGATVTEILVRNRRAAGVTLASGERIEADAVICDADSPRCRRDCSGRRSAARCPERRPLAVALRGDMGALGDRAGFPAGSPQRVLLPRLRRGVRRHFRARHDCRRNQPSMSAHRTAAPAGPRQPERSERLLVLINAPANGDHHDYNAAEIEQCATKTFGVLARCGLAVDRRPEATV